MRIRLILIGGLLLWLPASIGIAENTFYDAAGKRGGYFKRAQGQTIYYNASGTKLGYSRKTGTWIFYYDRTGKLLGRSEKEEPSIFFLKFKGR
jgi:hypothetical protein